MVQVMSLFAGGLLALPLVAYFLTVRLLVDFCMEHGAACSRWLLYFVGVFMTPVTVAVYALLCVLAERGTRG